LPKGSLVMVAWLMARGEEKRSAERAGKSFFMA
jgi:hypothetical protein